MNAHLAGAAEKGIIILFSYLMADFVARNYETFLLEPILAA
jgi:hypothetical protein